VKTITNRFRFSLRRWIYRGVIGLAVATTATLGADHFHKVTVRSMAIFEDPEGAIDFENDASALDRVGPWVPVAGSNLNLGYGAEHFFVRLVLLAPPDISREWVLSLASSDIDSVEFYITRPGKTGRWERSGNFAAPEDKAIDAAEPAFPLILEPGRETTAYLRIRSDSYKKFPIEVYTVDEFESQKIWHNSYHILFLMIGLALVCYNLYAFARTREIFRLWVALFIVLNTIALWSGYGNAHNIGWPTYPVWRNQIHYFLCSLALIFAAQVTRYFAGSRARERAANITGIAATIASPLLLADLSAHGRILVYTAVFSLAAPLLIGASIDMKRNFRGNRIGWAWAVYFLFGSMGLLFFNGVLPFHRIFLYGGAFALPLTGLLLTPRISIRAITRETKDPTMTGKYSKSKLQGVDVEAVVDRLNRLMGEEKIFTDSDLRMEDLAKRLSIAPYHLSEILNNVLNINYAAYVNRYRVEEVQRLLVVHPELNVLTAAFQAGFDTKSNFNRVFKAMVGATPVEYRRKNAS
jgi:AraC-like DNA-binding protein